VTENSGCGNRRAFIKAGMGAAIGTGSAIIVANQAHAQKLPQAAIQYQPTPRGAQRCDACLHWQPPNACAIVQSPIAPSGWCAAFAPKA
jgi:hypothetical protein